MSANTSPTQETAPTTPSPQAQATSSAAKTAPTAAPANASPSTFSTIGSLQAANPEFWKEFMMGLAMNICSDMEKSQERLKQLNAKAREDSGQA